LTFLVINALIEFSSAVALYSLSKGTCDCA
jgi:hypothetical protein